MRWNNWKIPVLVVVALFVPFLYAHICHSIFRTPGLLAVRPEKDVATLRSSGTFKVYVQNNYIARLSNVQLTAKASDPKMLVNISPASIERLLPGERVDFTVKVTVKDGLTRDVDVAFSIDARELKMRPVENPTDEDLMRVMRRAYRCGAIHAAEVLASRGRKEGVEYLKAAIRRGNRTDSGARVVRGHNHFNAGHAALLAGRMGHKNLAPYLRERYKVEKSTWIRGCILTGLARLGFAEDGKLLAQAADDQDPLLRAFGLLGLTMRGDSDAPQKLKAAAQESSGIVRILDAWAGAIAKEERSLKILQLLSDKKAYKDGELSVQPTGEDWRKLFSVTDEGSVLNEYRIPPMSGDKVFRDGWMTRIMAGEALLDLTTRK